MADSWLKVLTNGWAEKVAAIPEVAELAIPVRKGLVVDPPDRVILIHPYIPTSESLDTGQFLYAVQLRIRSPKGAGGDEVLDLQEAVWRHMNNLEYADFGGITVPLTWRQVAGDLALDSQGRPDITDSYYMTGTR